MIVCTQHAKQESPSGLSTKERGDDYRSVLWVCGKWRVIVCKGNLQWIIQRAKKAGTERRWHGVSYLTSKTSLMALWAVKTGGSGQSLSGIPETFRGDNL